MLNMQLLYPGVYNQTYAHIINQYGVDAQVGVLGRRLPPGQHRSAAPLGPRRGLNGRRRISNSSSPSSPRLAFTAEYATTLTEAGYVGEDVENIILKLLQAADGDVTRT